MTEDQLSPERVASIKVGVEEARVGNVVEYERGHFSRLAAELGDDED